MGCFRLLLPFKIICSAFVLPVFALSSAQPKCSINFGIQEINTGYKIKKIKDRIARFNPSSSKNEVIDTFLEIKLIADKNGSNQLSLRDGISRAREEMKKKGHYLDKSEWKKLEKHIEKREKKLGAKAVYQEVSSIYGLEFNDCQFEEFYEKTYGTDNSDADISLEVTIGITLVLCGVYMMTIPIPLCQSAGIYFMDAGFCFLGSEGWEYIKEWGN